MSFRERLWERLETADTQDLIVWGFTIITVPIWAPIALVGFLGACVVALAHHYVDGWQAWRSKLTPQPCTHERLEPWHDGYVHCLICTAILPGEVCPECLGAKNVIVREEYSEPCPKCHGVGVVVKTTPGVQPEGGWPRDRS